MGTAWEEGQSFILIALEKLPADETWIHRPTNPELCLVSSGLISLFDGISTSVDAEAEIPKDFFLEQNYPNPFNPGTTVSYKLPNTSQVYIAVYDMLGREVKTLVNKTKSAGNWYAIWDGRSTIGSQAVALSISSG